MKATLQTGSRTLHCMARCTLWPWALEASSPTSLPLELINLTCPIQRSVLPSASSLGVKPSRSAWHWQYLCIAPAEPIISSTKQIQHAFRRSQWVVAAAALPKSGCRLHAAFSHWLQTACEADELASCVSLHLNIACVPSSHLSLLPPACKLHLLNLSCSISSDPQAHVQECFACSNILDTVPTCFGLVRHVQ